MKILFKRIATAIYWKSFTGQQEKEINAILHDDDFASAHSKANAICDYLEIEKRGNRSALTKLLESTPLFD